MAELWRAADGEAKHPFDSGAPPRGSCVDPRGDLVDEQDLLLPVDHEHHVGQYFEYRRQERPAPGEELLELGDIRHGRVRGYLTRLPPRQQVLLPAALTRASFSPR